MALCCFTSFRTLGGSARARATFRGVGRGGGRAGLAPCANPCNAMLGHATVCCSVPYYNTVVDHITLYHAMVLGRVHYHSKA